MNKLSLVGMHYLKIYRENFDVSSKGPSSGVNEILFLYFQVVASLPTKACSFDWHYLH
jgi:hypothetical protein